MKKLQTHFHLLEFLWIGLSNRIYLIPDLSVAFIAFKLASDANGCVASTRYQFYLLPIHLQSPELLNVPQ